MAESLDTADEYSVHRHFIIYKPYGYLSQFINNQTRRTNKKLLGELHDFPAGVMSIGRLDQDSEGLLLLTTNGKLSALVRGRKIEKEYYIQVDGLVTDEAVEKLKAGVDISIKGKSYRTLPAECFKLADEPFTGARARKVRDERHGPTSWISVCIREGKFRQVRKMAAAVGFPVLRLVRVRIGNVQLSDMQIGAIQEVDHFDLF